MERYVAFLRGMNLGGRRIKNEELRAEFEQLGFADVATFRASGNVIFAADDESERALTRLIEGGLGEALDYEVPVYLRSCAEVAAIAAQEPFDAKLVEASNGKLQVSLLLEKPPRRTGRQCWRWPPTRTASRSKAASSSGCPAAACWSPGWT